MVPTTQRRRLWPAAGVIMFVLCMYWFGFIDMYIYGKEVWPDRPADIDHAPQVPTKQFLERPVLPSASEHQYAIPKYIHQSWKSPWLSQKIIRWSQTCRAIHLNWEWMLWTDEDNLRLVEQHFPWFLDTYHNLPVEINRADAARNMYMYVYGGVYIDLDVECLKPMEELFHSYNVPMLTRNENGEVLSDEHIATDRPVAFFGRMGFDGKDLTLFHTIPNAWMAATPGHPLFLLILQNLDKAVKAHSGNLSPDKVEALTGPVALYHDIEQYTSHVDSHASFDELFAGNPSWTPRGNSSPPARVTVLPPKVIYPFPWNHAGDKYRYYCQTMKPLFNSKRCKAAVTTPESYAISYWSHTW